MLLEREKIGKKSIESDTIVYYMFAIFAPLRDRNIYKNIRNESPSSPSAPENNIPCSSSIPSETGKTMRIERKKENSTLRAEDCSFPFLDIYSNHKNKMIEKWKLFMLRSFFFGRRRLSFPCLSVIDFEYVFPPLKVCVGGRKWHNWGIIGLWCFFLFGVIVPTFVLELFTFKATEKWREKQEKSLIDFSLPSAPASLLSIVLLAFLWTRELFSSFNKQHINDDEHKLYRYIFFRALLVSLESVVCAICTNKYKTHK